VVVRGIVTTTSITTLLYGSGVLLRIDTPVWTINGQSVPNDDDDDDDEQREERDDDVDVVEYDDDDVEEDDDESLDSTLRLRLSISESIIQYYF